MYFHQLTKTRAGWSLQVKSGPARGPAEPQPQGAVLYKPATFLSRDRKGTVVYKPATFLSRDRKGGGRLQTCGLSEPRGRGRLERCFPSPRSQPESKA